MIAIVLEPSKLKGPVKSRNVCDPSKQSQIEFVLLKVFVIIPKKLSLSKTNKRTLPNLAAFLKHMLLSFPYILLPTDTPNGLIYSYSLRYESNWLLFWYIVNPYWSLDMCSKYFTGKNGENFTPYPF